MLRLRQLKYGPRSPGLAPNLPRSVKLTPLSAVRLPVNSALALAALKTLRTASSASSKRKQSKRKKPVQNVQWQKLRKKQPLFNLDGDTRARDFFRVSNGSWHSIMKNDGERGTLAHRGTTILADASTRGSIANIRRASRKPASR